jgi:hypothetical protein
MFVVEQSIVIQRPRSAVYQFIRKPGNIALLQPFVAALEFGEEGGSSASSPAPPATQGPHRYRAIEVIPLVKGLFRLRNVIHVEQTNDDLGEGLVTSALRIEGPAPLGRLLSLSGVQTLTLKPAPGQGGDLASGAAGSTLVIDRFEFHVYPRPLRRFIEATANKAHQAILARLKEKLEDEAAT